MNSNPLVQLIYRKKNNRSFSIEKVFATIRPLLAQKVLLEEQYAYSRAANPQAVLKNLLKLKKIKGDLFHITGDIHYAVFAFSRASTILTIHDCVFLNNSAGLKHWIFKKVWLQWPVKYARVVTTISDKTKQEIIQYTGCRPEKIVVINNPVSQHIRQIKKEPGIGKPVILFIGTKPNKNLPRAIESLKGIPCLLEIIGKLTPEQQEALGQAGIEYKNYTDLRDEEVADRYVACDLVLFPSLYEGFGLPLIEAQQAGRPVVVSNISPMKEIAGDSACLVNPEDADSIREGILRVIHDAAYREELVGKGLKNIENYTVEKIAGQYIRLYTSLLSGETAGNQ